jgi:hypothetical protein
MEQERNGANGLTIVQAVSEFTDNAFDANSTHFTMIALPPQDRTVSQRGFLVGLDTGTGARDLLPFYGIGPNVCRKTGVARGLKNYGNRAAIGCMMPTTVTHITRHQTAARSSTLTLSLGALYQAIDAAKATTCDYRRIDEHELPTVLRNTPAGGLTDETRELLDTILGTMTVGSPNRAFIESILANTLTSFHLMVLDYDVFPTGMMDHLVNAFQSYRMSYCYALRNGLRLELETPSTTIKLQAEDAIDPLGTAPRITGMIEIYSTGLKVTLGSQAFWVIPSDHLFYDGRTARNPFIFAEQPADWAPAATDTLQISFSVPSAQEEREQLDKVGSSIYRSVMDMRGVYLRYHDRYLGMPVYNKDNWEEKRNVGALRVELVCTNPTTAEEWLGIQTKKHTSSFTCIHDMLQLFLNWLVARVIVPKFSHCGVCKPLDGRKGNSPGVTDWQFPYLCKLMLDAKATPTQLVAPAPAPIPAPIPNPPSIPRPRAITAQEFVRYIYEFKEYLDDSNLEELTETAQNTEIVAGLTTFVTQLKKIRETLEEMGV